MEKDISNVNINCNLLMLYSVASFHCLRNKSWCTIQRNLDNLTANRSMCRQAHDHPNYIVPSNEPCGSISKANWSLTDISLVWFSGLHRAYHVTVLSSEKCFRSDYIIYKTITDLFIDYSTHTVYQTRATGARGGSRGGSTGHIPPPHPTPTDVRHTGSITQFQYCTVGLQLFSYCMTLTTLTIGNWQRHNWSWTTSYLPARC